MIIDSRYKVKKEMGRGPWSIVYRVEDMRNGGDYALKLFDGVTSSEFNEYFSPERMHHIMKIRHNNLVNIFDFGNFNQHIYYLSEFYQKYTLAKFTFTPVSLEVLYDILVKLCYGLSALHSQNLVHQLLKPTNIGYSVEDGKVEVKIMDYGFTKVDFTKTNGINEYLPYLAPEIFKNQKATPRSDFFSLGVILYQLTTNTLPFSIRNMHQFQSNPKLNQIPQFPRQINPAIPVALENMILQLIDVNPEERFGSAEEIISYINNHQPKKYAFSQIHSEVNKIQLSDYIVREDYSHDLVNHLSTVEKGNGKLIMLSAGKGMGKTDALVLFRYHLLTGEYFIFDYNCSAQNKDPFFALIKEFYHSVENNSQLQQGMCEISERMNNYVFENAELIDNDSNADLDRDFKAASEFLQVLAQERPLVFTIRSCQYMTGDVIDFLNFFSSKYLPNLPIMIILSVNDPRKLKKLKYPIEIKMEPLSLDDTREYVSKLLSETPDDEFLRNLWLRSYGNPGFIERILIDMTMREIIWENEKLVFKGKMKNYQLPNDLVEAIYSKMSHLNSKVYLELVQMSSLRVPKTHELLRYVLNISDKELFFLINDAENNEILYEENHQVNFTYKEARERFDSECEKESRKRLSERVLAFFADEDLRQQGEEIKNPAAPLNGKHDDIDVLKTNNLLTYIKDVSIDDEITLRGLIYHCLNCKDYYRQKLYEKFLAYYYGEKKQYVNAFLTMVEVIKLDLEKQLAGGPGTLREDIYILIEYANWMNLNHIPADFARMVRRMKHGYEKSYLMGVFDLEVERNIRAFISLKKALKAAETEEERMRVLFYLGRYYVRADDYKELKKVLTQLEKMELTDEFEVIYTGLKGFELANEGDYHGAIGSITDYLSKQAGSTKPGFFVELGGLYINLGQYYNHEHDYKKEYDCYHDALDIWQSIGYERKLGIVYNNLGDIALRQGKTVQAFEYFLNAITVSEKVNNLTSILLSYLNYGEAYIKQGEFEKAEENLRKAEELSNRMESDKFKSSIINNLAIARSKQKNFEYYRSYIAENSPGLLRNEFKAVTPIVKTWFYYLSQLGDIETLERLLNETGNILNTQPEFYWQTKGNLHFLKRQYEDAQLAYENCLEYAKRSNSEYALAIVNLHLARVKTAQGNIREARIHEQITFDLCKRNRFQYWEAVINLVHQSIELQDESVNLRKIIRELNKIIKLAVVKSYFQIELDAYYLLYQIFKFLRKRSGSKQYLKIYKQKMLAAAADIPEEERELYLYFNQYYDKEPAGIQVIIAERTLTSSNVWHENLYELVKIKEPLRVPFLLQKIFNNIFAPNQIAVMLNQQIKDRSAPMLFQNITLTELYSEAYLINIKACLEQNRLIEKKINDFHVIFIPLQIKSLKKGCLILADSGELNFQKYEIEMMSFIRLHLTAMLMRGEEFHQLNERITLMNKLIEATGNLFEVISVKRMQEDITRSAIRMMNAVRGFFITQEGLGNYSIAVAIDETNNILDRFGHFGREVLGQVTDIKQPIFVNKDRNSQLVPQMASGSMRDLEIYAAPIIIDDQTYGYIYLDNANSQKRKLVVNREFTPLFLRLMTAMLRNALRYSRLLEIESKTNQLENHKEKFIQIVSHELQQPVSVLRNLMNTISSYQHDPELDEVMESFNEKSSQLNTRINEIVEHFHYSLLEKVDVQKVDLRQVLEAAKLRAEEMSKERRLYFTLDLPSAPVYAAIDLRVFNILLDKLLMNTIRFSIDLSLTTLGLRSATTQAEKVQDMESIIIYIKDEGIGIKPKELENIFQEFYEVNDIYSHRSGITEFNSSGLGLGLSTAQQIVNLHGGNIWASANDNGKGTTFYISLPLADVKDAKL
ncbi:MAG: tetratricopeptide repeat protein [Candidatus Stygibacter frigidus]|nr:tetratricopeptide repeat protein [Candidatus Stygibacter frigidus]